MTGAKKILITTESHESFILRVHSKKRAFGHCPECNRGVEILSIDQAVSISQKRTSDLVRDIEAGRIHGIETEAGHILVCADSVTRNAQELKGGQK